jgi:hypothetical protein
VGNKKNIDLGIGLSWVYLLCILNSVLYLLLLLLLKKPRVFFFFFHLSQVNFVKKSTKHVKKILVYNCFLILLVFLHFEACSLWFPFLLQHLSVISMVSWLIFVSSKLLACGFDLGTLVTSVYWFSQWKLVNKECQFPLG